MRPPTPPGNNKIANTQSDANKEIKTINQRISVLEQEREVLIAKRDSLVRQFSLQQDISPQTPVSLSKNQKIELFKQLFKGRSDVFAGRWENSKGRSGYSVACHNEWVPGTCNKPSIKCNECLYRKYKALDDQAVYAHLIGKQIVGLYPLLTDNTCHLLAIDFDKADWRDAVKAMARVCLQLSIPYATEISRSGNGAHLWIFFSEAVQARDVRLLGFALLDKAMEIYPDLSFESYDRLFPNQDFMPEGGFGNLIALPLQYQARQQANSQFVDRELLPYTDQWLFLAQMQTLSSKQLGDFLEELTPDYQHTLGQRVPDTRPPWEQGTRAMPIKIDNCPKQITLVLANHIYIKIDEIPSLLTARLKRLGSFSNPVFFKTQAMRFSTHGIPRYITCARIEQGYLFLPRGCFDEVIKLLKEQNITAEIDDKREPGENLKRLKFLGKLRKDQSKAVNVMTQHNTGVLHAPTAFGKTVVAIQIIAKRKTNTLILTHNLQLLEQWQERLKSFLPDTEIGTIRGGRKKPTGQIDIATYQSLINRKDNSIDALVQDYGQIIIDECHHLSAPGFEMVLNDVRAKYVLGLTATPERQDGHQKIIFMTAGPIRHKVKATHSEKFEQQVIVTQVNERPPIELINPEQRPHISDVYRWLVENNKRTRTITDDVIANISEGKHPLVLTERRKHAEIINQLLVDRNIQTVILRGAMRAKERKAASEQLNNAQVIVATGKYIGEGFDLPRLDTLFLAMPIAWRGLLAQYAGRIHRESAGKERVTIFDYVDASIPMLQRMYNKRAKGYKAMGYQIVLLEKEISPNAGKITNSQRSIIL